MDSSPLTCSVCSGDVPMFGGKVVHGDAVAWFLCSDACLTALNEEVSRG